MQSIFIPLRPVKNQMKRLHESYKFISKNFIFSSYNFKIKSTLSFAKHNNHYCREFSRKKTTISLFALELRGLDSFKKQKKQKQKQKHSFSAGPLLLCLIFG
jgi:hypothetical protein